MLTPSFTGYVGRFAPSPSGPLHFGSLVAALASFLDARAHRGRWLVRMEDTDTPRCIAGADRAILTTLRAHGLYWDDEVLYQSTRSAAYQHVIDSLLDSQQAYFCTCTRKVIRQYPTGYPGACRHLGHGPQNAAVRFNMASPKTFFTDRIQGPQHIDEVHALEDFVLRRRDGLYAYNLAVVVDDIFQQVNHVVRGSDILPTTAAHLTLYNALGETPPTYAHIPVAATEHGYKLSKQNKAAPLDNQKAVKNLVMALNFLHLQVPDTLTRASCDKILAWAVSHFRCEQLPHVSEIIVDKRESTYYNQSI